MDELQLPLYAEQIRKILPHRYPFLLVDRVTELVPGERAVGYKLVSQNEPQFTGHFPEFSLFPGVLTVEAMAQLGGVAILMKPEFQNKLPVFAGVDGVRFRGQVRPGDKLDMELTIDRLRGSMGKGTGIAKVDGKVVCEGTLMFALTEVPTA
jgi:3-hydroxyacyl-[acyl-carrier-protein] dehydratase